MTNCRIYQLKSWKNTTTKSSIQARNVFLPYLASSVLDNPAEVQRVQVSTCRIAILGQPKYEYLTDIQCGRISKAIHSVSYVQISKVIDSEGTNFVNLFMIIGLWSTVFLDTLIFEPCLFSKKWKMHEWNYH